MSQNPASSINLLDLCPTRLKQWEETPDGLVVLLIPKFSHRWLAPLILPRMKHPNFRMALDAYGSFVWKRCDGTATVGAIVEEMKTVFPEDGEGLYNRTGIFVRRLVKEEFLALPVAP